MKIRSTLLAASILLALTACNKPAEPAAEAPAAEAAPAPEAAPAAEAAAPAADAAATDTAAAPAAGECSFDLEGNDAMQYNVKNIDVPKSCTEFTINLKHTGKMPVAAMGHNVVVASAADMNGVAADGATVQPDHVKAGDTRIIAHSGMVGGGETTSVKFEVSKIAAGGFNFFCTFPGHSALMNGTLTVK
ncbi:azurin [Lysobacter oculi]|uniref:Azurin n=1 Tax=Solilutibacter oculi TaxID=2698682 RepID=A0A344J4E3_9GAMM|nr:azurin [Lysobacter oculi]